MVYTIGHSTHDFGEFAAILKDFGVSVIVDVRSTPYSRWNKGFRKEALDQNTEMGYEFLGDKLGGRSTQPGFFNDKGRIVYSRLAETKEFRDGLEQVQKMSQENDIALMCSEKHPLMCHRAILIARKLKEVGNEARHILMLNNVKRPVGLAHEELINEFTKVIVEAVPSDAGNEAISTWLRDQDVRKFIKVLDGRLAEKNDDLFVEGNGNVIEDQAMPGLGEGVVYDWLEENFAYQKKP